MDMIVLVVSLPVTLSAVQQLAELNRALEPLPDGVWQAAANVWLVDPSRALDFALKAAQSAAAASLEIRAYIEVPKPPAAA